MEQKPIAFNMIVQQEEAAVIAIMLNTMVVVKQTIHDPQVEIVLKFRDEFVRKYHECGWCTDPLCTYPIGHDKLST